MLKKRKTKATANTRLDEVEAGTKDRQNKFVQQYDKPKIVALDLDQATEDALRANGFNVATGSFGTPYKVRVADGYTPVIVNGRVPHNISEQEIIIVDLHPGDYLPGPVGTKASSDGAKDWWVSCSQGIVDPRPRMMASLKDRFDKIYSHGGVFVIFASPRHNQKAVWAYNEHYRGFVIDSSLPYDNWCFLSALDTAALHVEPEHGEEIQVVDTNNILGQVIHDYLEGAQFDCTFSGGQYSQDFISLAVNKYGAVVAAILAQDDAKGGIVLLPDLEDKGAFLVELLRDVLPALVPTLFPHLVATSWADSAAYEFPGIRGLKSEIELIIASTEAKVAALNERIGEERATYQYLVDLLSMTGSDLVGAVKRALEVLGFEAVIDVDKAIAQENPNGFLSEDLCIEDKTPLLLVEVKGVNGKPSDNEAMQVQKHVHDRMKELGRTDIQGLTIINHERHLPPLDRENKAPFRDVILTNANRSKFGLLTTWDLVRLVRSFLKNGWSHDDVKPVFYRYGRIEPIPEHYEYVGTIQEFWEKPGVISVLIENATLRRGDRVGFELPVEFEEQDNASMQINHLQVEEAIAGSIVAIATSLTKNQARKGTRVFRVKQRV